jgi:hypothetical protein
MLVACDDGKPVRPLARESVPGFGLVGARRNESGRAFEGKGRQGFADP